MKEREGAVITMERLGLFTRLDPYGFGEVELVVVRLSPEQATQGFLHQVIKDQCVGRR